MNFIYDSIEQFENEYAELESFTVDCKCGGKRNIIFEDSNVVIKDYCIKIVNCAVLRCRVCGKGKLGNLIPRQIIRTYMELEDSEYSSCTLTERNERFSYVEYADFVYDSRDLNIPGLSFDLDPTNARGFSCPVFFDKKVLNNFATDSDYSLNYVSESYGSISKKGTGGWTWEWDIPFGLNKNNRVILFLGDLRQIEENDRAILWLKSYNICSDHEIIDTEFFRAQFQNVFSEPIIEKRILKLRNSFFSKVQTKYGIKLHHLEEEVEASSRELCKPINYSRNEVKDNIIILDGLLYEGIDCEQLRELYKKVVFPLPNNLNDLKTRKLLQGIIAVKAGKENAKKLMAPLFYLNDLRVCYAHLISANESEKMLNAIVVAYHLESKLEYEKLYNTLVDDLYNLYSYLMTLSLDSTEGQEN